MSNIFSTYVTPQIKEINHPAYLDEWKLNIDASEWFPFLTNMEHTENQMQEDKGLSSSLLKMFDMFEIRLSFGDEYLDALSIKFINCKRETGLNLETSFTWVYY